ncbi:polycystin-1-like protein 2 [Amphiura filiformis]|uniref:polycystin-1-like protein 2 n=1 Tax=Amphiura filiformis TaxID=82378 RepID=UPI003B224A1E
MTDDGELVVRSLEVTDPVNVTFKTYMHSCVYRDMEKKSWDGKGCKVSPASTLTTTKCICNHMTSFASSFYVPVNKIDFAYVFANANLAENHTVFTTIICLLAFYVLMLIWLRKKDKDDLLKWSAHPLIDNQHGHGYFYTISVHTGFATNAGTRSTVRFDMVGKKGSTGQRLLWDAEGYLKLDDGSLNHYVLKLPRSIGELESLLIWHDNTGEAGFASWYLDWVLISDLQTGERWAFVCSEWLAKDKGSGIIFRSLKPASEEAAAKIQSDFFRILRGTFADDNLWVSLFTRPTPSSFTRIQRLSVCLTFLFLYMITNAMFYRTDDEAEELPQGKTWRVGPFEIDSQEVYIGGISTLIILPVNLILVVLFKSVQMSYEGETGLAQITSGDGETKRFSRRCSAPPIMKYIAWSLVFASIVLSAFFVVMYSLMWGHDKSKAWLMSMLTSFLESLLLVEPAKAICAAIIILLIFKFSKKANFHEPNTVVYQEELASPTGAGPQLAKAPNADKDSQQEEWEKKTATASLFRQIVSHLTFVIITILIILQHQGLDAFYMTQQVNNVFLGPEEEFTEIRDSAGFWEWTNDVFIPAVFPTDESLPLVDDHRILTDGVMFLTGPVRIRQLRLDPSDKCKTSRQVDRLGVHCKPSYMSTEEDSEVYGTMWDEWTNETCSDNGDSFCPWSYYSSKQLANPVYHGKTGVAYDGGGYVSQWEDFTADTAIHSLHHLEENNWLDQYTAAVFVEFTLYNANINMFSYVTYLLEFSPMGHINPFPWVHTFRLYDYTSSADIEAITVSLTYLLFVMSLIYFIIREIDDMKRAGKKYLLSVSNWLEMSIIVSSVIVLLGYMVRKVYVDTTSRALQEAQETETWLTNDDTDNELIIEGYNLCRLDRIGMQHGGILCYVKDGVVFKEKSNLHDDNIEALWIEINLPHTKPLLLGTVYRVPNSKVDYIDKLDQVFQNYTSLYDDVIIVGDFNLDLCKRYEASKVNTLATHSNMKQLIKDYTRITETSKTKIDLAFVTKPDKVSSSGVHNLGLSDHCMIYVIRKNKQIKLPPKTIKTRSFKKFNADDFIDDMKNINWNDIMNYNDVNNAWDVWKKTFNDVCDKHAPLKEKRIKGHLPEWINGDYIKLTKDRDYFFSKAHKTNDPEDWKMAKSLRNKANNLNRYLKKKYCTDAIEENVFFTHLNLVLGVTTQPLQPFLIPLTTFLKT